PRPLRRAAPLQPAVVAEHQDVGPRQAAAARAPGRCVQQAGFDADLVHECHGSIHHLQCLRPCNDEVWEARGFEPEVDEARCRLL
ncbi:hypothetical protein P8631_20780, partial [Guyparkeria sp. 1SP6A2]|nr:hypothetical protein [Guyparkeria sp. 1SP6A2]